MRCQSRGGTKVQIWSLEVIVPSCGRAIAQPCYRAIMSSCRRAFVPSCNRTCDHILLSLELFIAPPPKSYQWHRCLSPVTGLPFFRDPSFCEQRTRQKHHQASARTEAKSGCCTCSNALLYRRGKLFKYTIGTFPLV